MVSEQLDIFQVYFPFGVHLSADAWPQFGIAELAAPLDARDDAAVRAALRMLAQRMNEHRPNDAPPVQPGLLLCLNTLQDVLRYIVDRYCLDENMGAMLRCLRDVSAEKGAPLVERPIPTFVRRYPPAPVQLGRQTAAAFLADTAEGRTQRYVVARELVLLALVTANRAARAFHRLYDDTPLREEVPYPDLIAALEARFDREPAVLNTGYTLFKLLRAPLEASPDDLEGQLDYIRTAWAAILPEFLLKRLVHARDVLQEERQMRGFPGGAPAPVLEFRRGRGADYPEPERFTRDLDWMSNVVLIAKTVYVWLDQLSKHYGRTITRLDDIPDEELDRLARWGFTGLWLIGVWARSNASRTIKQHMGNPEALSSAYSLYDYVIADDLGGEAAYERLRDRAWQRGIRLASDMVPNHVGIYSKWVVEHPDWFVQSPHPPFPGYRFTGPDLSEDGRISIRIEDGYYNHSDAAVVFERRDNWSNHTRYMYHGNDGTHMPWNDTAQLNYLLPEVREAVIQTILHVARKFPIIRFDAAMTLAKKHFQRLWFPQPGDAGAIPSRADHSMTREEFDAHMPEEFWREVVERVQREVPETLLLAEAFWLMEGYFVRTLGMHRVYNSAFMNMLKMEENEKFRATVRNVLEFSPEILKRFVNFMNNPDELTAVEQFGRGDKYFGVAMMMATMPGLPMFGHGQIEGFTEKYGMEYRRAYYDERVDDDLVRRHEYEIFPLLRRRYLFSGSENFAFFDFVTPSGRVDENVFAYSNRAYGDRALVIYNNAYTTSSGWIDLSTAVNVGTADFPHLIRRTLAEALNLRADDGYYYIFRDGKAGLEFIRSGRELGERGLFAELHAYEYHVFLDFREVHDSDGRWSATAAYLAGHGVPSVEEAHRERYLAPLLNAFRDALQPEFFAALSAVYAKGETPDFDTIDVAHALRKVLRALEAYVSHAFVADAIVRDIEADLASLGALARLRTQAAKAKSRSKARDFLAAPMPGPGETAEAPAYWHVPIAWCVVRHLGKVHTPSGFLPQSRWCMREWLLAKALEQVFGVLPQSDSTARADAQLVTLLITHSPALARAEASRPAAVLGTVLNDDDVQAYLGINEYQGVVYVNREQLERFLYWLTATGCVHAASNGATAAVRNRALSAMYRVSDAILKAAEAAGYQVHRAIERLVPRAAGKAAGTPAKNPAKPRTTPAKRRPKRPSPPKD